jgi:hypothetical protein
LAWPQIQRRFYDRIIAAAHNTKSKNFILLDKFQFALPPDWNALILRAADIDPVGVGPLPVK